MEQDPDAPPNFWFQPPLTTNRRRTPLIDPVVLIIILPIVALLFLFFFLPPVLFHTSHILKPSSVKSTWDSLNIFLVLFAIICGVLARRNDEASSSGYVADQANSLEAESRNSAESSDQWVSFSDRKVMTSGLRRSSSSYPDLRQEPLWVNADNRNRVYDDFDVDIYSSPVSRYYNNLSRRMGRERERERENLYRSTPVTGDILQRPRRSEADRGEFSEVKEIAVDTFEVTTNTSDFREHVSVTPPPPPPPPPSSLSANSRRHSFRSVGRKGKVDKPRKIDSGELDQVKSYHPPPSPPPPPPPPPPRPPQTEVLLPRSHHKHKKLERKVSDATKEIATAISSLYNQRKKKNKRKLRNTSSSSDSSPSSVHSIQSPEMQEPQKTVPPSPPPPPPPPPFMFQNLFKKGSKHKKIHSVPVTVSARVPPPPPPPPPSSIFNNIFKTGSKSKRFHSPSTVPPPHPPPPPSSIMNNLFKNGTKSKRFNSSQTATSPPPPPPLPPPMTPPRYIVPINSKRTSRRQSQPQPQPPSPPSPQKLEPRNHRGMSKGKPPLPKPTSYYERDDFLPSGSQSPLIPMPPPPPPPFKISAMKFELRGDFVKIQSTHSSVCSSPDRDGVDLSSTTIGGGDLGGPTSGPGPLFFPSPDVNAKADSFISRLKDEWRMEKINSIKDKTG